MLASAVIVFREAGALITALPTLAVFVFLGRYFLRGLMAGSLMVPAS